MVCFHFFFRTKISKKRCITTEQNRTSQSYSDKSLPLFIINTTGFFCSLCSCHCFCCRNCSYCWCVCVHECCCCCVDAFSYFVILRSLVYTYIGCWASVVVYKIGARVHRGRQACKQTRGNILWPIYVLCTQSHTNAISGLMHSS